MTEQEKKMKKYCSRVERRLNLPKSVKKRVMNDFRSSIDARREAGETDEQMIAELGTPKEAAAVLNEQMKEYAYRKSPWRWAALAGAAVSGLILLWTTAVNWLLNLLFSASLTEAQSLGIIGGADGPTAIFVTRGTGVDPDAVLSVIILAVCLLVWWRLSHLKQK